LQQSHENVGEIVKLFLKMIATWFGALIESLLRNHASERKHGMRFAEEARAERLANMLRFAFAANWLSTTSTYVPGNRSIFNAINLGSGGMMLLAAVVYHAWLFRRPYRSVYKYITTTFDMVMGTGVLVAYAIVAGPVFVLKMPIYLTIPCMVVLAALRTQRRLAIYAGVLSIVMLVGFWAWLQLWFGIDYGSRVEHAFGPKVNPTYLIDTIAFMVGFSCLAIAGTYNVRRQLNLRVAEAERVAREEERELMAAGLAHEIRNPLGSIHGFAQLLRDEGRGAPRYVEAILEDVRRLNGVLEGFLRFTRPYPIKPEQVDLVALVTDFCRADLVLNPASGLELMCQRDKLILRTDPDAVRQILHNLIRNARRFQPAGVPMRVRLAGDDLEVRLMVEDDGPGVAPELLQNLFTPFQTSEKDGTGLGLSLSRKLARELGGDLYHALSHEHLESSTGTVFVLVLRPFRRQENS
jgi:signal transduction histidine kinase